MLRLSQGATVSGVSTDGRRVALNVKSADEVHDQIEQRGDGFVWLSRSMKSDGVEDPQRRGLGECCAGLSEELKKLFVLAYVFQRRSVLDVAAAKQIPLQPTSESLLIEASCDVFLARGVIRATDFVERPHVPGMRSMKRK